MRNRYLLGAGVALAVAFGCAQANAQVFGPYPPGAFYFGPEGGWTHLTSQNPSVTVQGPRGYVVGNQVDRQVNFNSGFNAGARLGYMWGPWRFEGEYSYRNNDVSNSGTGAVGRNGSAFVESNGSAHSNAIMANVLYDFTFGWPVTPHIGGGIGAVDVVRSFGGSGTATGPNGNTVSFTTTTPSVSSWQFGYQAIAGLRYLINPALALDIDYRYLATAGSGGTTSGSAFAQNSTLAQTTCCFVTKVGNVKYGTQNIVASLTMMFGAPPPAAPPPAPPAPPPPPPHQVYLVFFDWDKYNITPEGMQILQAAAAHWKAGGAVQIQVTGYTDLSGSAGYNQRLSERRANAVAVALESMGVPRAEMIVAGRGMNDPRVPTPLGVREPQNRRVEIVFP
jgi:OmpA-OmpF porin, OOP family